MYRELVLHSTKGRALALRIISKMVSYDLDHLGEDYSFPVRCFGEHNYFECKLNQGEGF